MDVPELETPSRLIVVVRKMERWPWLGIFAFASVAVSALGIYFTVQAIHDVAAAVREHAGVVGAMNTTKPNGGK